MTYNKPANMKYTDMAIYIDANVWKIVNKGENPEIEEKIFHYLYSLFYVLSCKHKYFNNFEDYDGYALYAAGETYMVLMNRWKHRGEEKRGKTIAPIKSCLNYIKATLYPLKVNYQRANFGQILNETAHKGLDVDGIREQMKESIREQYSEESRQAILDALTLLPGIIKKVVQDTPYGVDQLTSAHLYVSCLLSFLSLLDSASKATSKDKANSQALLIKRSNAIQESLVLWHLDNSMGAYITLLLNKVRAEFSKEIEQTCASYNLSDDVLESIMLSAYSEGASEGEED